MAKSAYGNWEIIESLDEGGQSLVFRVKDRTGQVRDVCALKRLKNPKRIDRFRNEVEAVAALAHPNVVPLIDKSALHDPVSKSDHRYLVMPIAEGGSLEDAERFKGDARRAIGVARQIAAGLQAAHTHVPQIVHRDVKPGNVLFPKKDADDVWISDFGICLIDDGRSRNTENGERPGPAWFMAPEFDRGGQLAVGPEADVYSLGKVIFFMLSGGEILPREDLNESPYREVLHGDGLGRLSALLHGMIRRDHKARIQTMAEVIGHLDSILAGMDSAGSHPDVDAASERLVKTETARDAKMAAARAANPEWDAAHANARRVLVETIEDQLEKLARDRDGAGTFIFEIGKNDASGRQKLGQHTYALSDSVELRWIRKEGDRRIWALMIQVCWRSSFDRKGRVGFLAELDVREGNGRRVGDCRGFVGKKEWGKGFALRPTAPVVFEQEPDAWLALDADIRKIVSDLFVALLEAVEQGTSIFVVSKLPRRPGRG